MISFNATGNDIECAVSDMVFELLDDDMGAGKPVDTGHWQAMRDVPMTKTIELHNATFLMDIPPTPGALASFVKPNLPWAEDHFKERVGGQPLNPGEQYKNWPYFKGNVDKHQTVEEVKFSHTYMERFWPRRANSGQLKALDFGASTRTDHKGIRYRYGDILDLFTLLTREPYTRQAYLPIWFPEDTGAHHGERVPCTLGYHFLLRDGKLHCFYPIRSCDLLRHFRDDVYMAGRLVQWVIEQLVPRTGEDDQPDRDHPSPWATAVPGQLTMFMPSLHIFQGDVPSLKRKYEEVLS